MEGLMRDLSVDNAKRADRVTSRRDTLKNAPEFFNGREMIIAALTMVHFHYPTNHQYIKKIKKSLFPQKILLQKVIMMNLTPHKISLIYKVKNLLHKDITS